MSTFEDLFSCVQEYDGRTDVYFGAKPGQEVNVRSKPMPPALMKYREQNLGLCNDGIIVAEGAGRNLAQRMIADPLMPAKLERFCDGRPRLLDSFIITDDEERVAEKFGLQLSCESKVVRELGSKSGFRAMARLAGNPIANGFEYLTTADEIYDAVIKLFSGYGVSQAVVKADWGASGIFQLRLNRASLPDLRRTIEQYCRESKFERGVVEEWVDGAVASVGTHFVCNGQIQAWHGPWQQYLENDQFYAGTTYPATVSDLFLQNLRQQGRRLAELYQIAGYRGYVGFDVLELANGECLWVECNARKGGVYYPQQVVHNYNLQASAIVARDVVAPVLEKMNFADLLAQSHDLLFDFQSDKPQGVIFYNIDCLRYGKVQIICAGRDLEQAVDYHQTFVERLQQLK